jgi:hypothetical protein
MNIHFTTKLLIIRLKTQDAIMTIHHFLLSQPLSSVSQFPGD